MTVFAQPASLKRAAVREHYEETILQPVAFDQHTDLLDAQVLQDLDRLFPGGRAQLWGVTPGIGDANLPQIRKMQPGDTVFFSGNKRLYLVGTVALTWHNPQLAHRLWGVDDRTEQTWEYMYALDGVRGIDFPMEEIRSLLGWKPNRNIQGFVALRGSDGEMLTDLVGFEASPPALSVPGQGERAKSTDGTTEGPTDIRAEAQRRAEQGRIKKALLPGAEGECALCGRTLPREFLVAAHIKKRSACDDAERWDIRNVAMLACLLGCDSLFEHGFITVESGGVLRISPVIQSAPAVAKYVKEHLANCTTPWWSAEREQYYSWHRSHIFQRGALTPQQVSG
ncbi:HNH endonuclease [Streptomyces violens]|uniref:HNH endonuclease n=1 Tax=Streptomyces violens TaxID=66377 RepID=UPI00068BA56D|nr:HNH endonuclease [Streptomyces violens]